MKAIRNQTNWTFMSSSGGRNESNSHQLARIGEKKISCQKEGIKRFWAQEAEMTTAISSL